MTALPLSKALARNGQRPRAVRLFLGSIVAGPLVGAVLLAVLTFLPRGS